MNRRDFLDLLIKSGAAAGATATGLPAVVAGLDAQVSSAALRGVAILLPADGRALASPGCQWALGRLKQSLAAQAVPLRLVSQIGEVRTDELPLIVDRTTAAAAMSADGVTVGLRVGGGRPFFDVLGSDDRGVVYALTEVADIVSSSSTPLAALVSTASRAQPAATPVRSVMRMFSSDIEDKGWFNDREFWREYLSMLATERFNRFNLAFGLGYDFATGLRDTYFYFAYPFLLTVPGYDVRATNLSTAERDRNLEMLRFISDETVARGLEFQLGIWTHAYVWQNSPNVNHVIEGLAPDRHAAYSRDALALLLKSCPNISGVTLRIHGESGVAEGSYDFWKTVFDGAVGSGRRVRLDLHAKGIDQPMIDNALATGLPITVSPKFWAEHMGLPYHQAAIRPTELPVPGRVVTGLMALSTGDRSFTRYGYGDLLAGDRKYSVLHRIWPGTQRVLLWGDPTFAAAYARSMTFCGSIGCEIMEPLSFKGRKGSGVAGGRDGYASVSVRTPGIDVEKYRYTYRLWGRMLHDPGTTADVWQRQLRQTYGAAAANSIELALSEASRILPLITTAHLPSAANNNYWPEMYTNMSIVEITPNREPYNDTPTPRRFGTVSPLDPQMFSTIEEHAAGLLGGPTSGKYSPVEVADYLDARAAAAATHLAEALRVAGSPSVAIRRACIDVSVQAGLGRFFAHKLRAGVLYALFDRTHARDALDRAIVCYGAARDEWARIVDQTRGVYVDDVSYGPGAFQRGHWADRLAAIDRDLTLMQAKRAEGGSADGRGTFTTAGLTSSSRAGLIEAVLRAPERPAFGIAHTPPASFVRGGAIDLLVTETGGGLKPTSVRCFYRRTHQAEAWTAARMESRGPGWRVTLSGPITASTFPVQYYFELTDAAGKCGMYPGFNATWSSQPYFVVQIA